MILPTPELLLAIGSALVALWCAVTVAAARARLARAPGEIKLALDQCRTECQGTVEKLLREFSTADSASPDPAREPGRLHRSTRTRALKLLRSGMAPDSAAACLEMPRKEILLLARVASILAR